mgnify:CR=1 FL=1
MLIRTQKRNVMYKFQFFMGVCIEPLKIKDGKRYKFDSDYGADVFAVYLLGQDTGEYLLGEYTTKEKAMKVLDLIYDTYRSLQFAEGIRFQMPKDSEV